MGPSLYNILNPRFTSSNREMMITLAVVAILLVVVFWNPKFAWSSYRGTHGWVKKRMHPLSDDQRQEMKSIEKLAEKLIGIQWKIRPHPTHDIINRIEFLLNL